MKVFKSLNCVLCEAPFVPIPNQSRSPRIWACREAICNECFEKEKLLDEWDRKHLCQDEVDCFHNPHFAYFLFDILSQDSLVLSPMFGYILVKPFQIPECVICHEEFSINAKEKSPIVLRCNHTICAGCYHMIRSRVWDDSMMDDGWMDEVLCSVCRKHSMYEDNFENKWNPLQEFLAELPEMTRQMEGIGKTKYRLCEGCNKLDSYDEMFYCEECQKGICGTCGLKNHRLHETLELLKSEAKKIANELQGPAINEIMAYEDLFPPLHKELIDDIGNLKTKLLSKVGICIEASNWETLRNKREKYKKLRNDFETFSEEYLPSLRKYDANVKVVFSD